MALSASAGAVCMRSATLAHERLSKASAESVALAKALKKRGFTFCGPVIVYAFMQAVGMYNEHLVTCPRHKACARIARK